MSDLIIVVTIVVAFGFLLAFDRWQSSRAERRSNRIMDEWAAHERRLKKLYRPTIFNRVDGDE